MPEQATDHDCPVHSFINGEWVEGVDKGKFEVINPATEEVITSVCEATEKDVDLAVTAARKAFDTTWAEVTPQGRGALMHKLANIAEKNLDTLAAVESLDNGKSITMAKGDVGAVIGCLRYYAGWADKIEGKTMDVSPDMFHLIRKEPVSCTRNAKSGVRKGPKLTVLSPALDWCLRSDHPLELPPPHVCLEDRPRPGHW